MTNGIIVVIRDSVVHSTQKFETATQAEKLFVDTIRSEGIISNFDTYNQDDIDATIEDGYIKSGTNSVCLVWI
jgi:hypothetical protein